MVKINRTVARDVYDNSRGGDDRKFNPLRLNEDTTMSPGERRVS
jgi:hypothetical protein